MASNRANKGEKERLLSRQSSHAEKPSQLESCGGVDYEAKEQRLRSYANVNLSPTDEQKMGKRAVHPTT